MFKYVLGAALALAFAAPAAAEVVEKSADHFVTRDSATVKAAPKATWLALIEPSQVNVVTGLAQAVALAGARPVGLLIALGIMGQFGAWIGGSARLAFAIGADRYLPPAFSRLHPRWQTPHVALLSQAAATTGFVLFLQSGERLGDRRFDQPPRFLAPQLVETHLCQRGVDLPRNRGDLATHQQVRPQQVPPVGRDIGQLELLPEIQHLLVGLLQPGAELLLTEQNLAKQFLILHDLERDLAGRRRLPAGVTVVLRGRRNRNRLARRGIQLRQLDLLLLL